MGVDGATTPTFTVEERDPVVPVTVTVCTAVFPPVLSVAVTVPVASVIELFAWMASELALKLIGTPAMTLLLASRASAVIVAVVEPSLRMVGELLESVSCETCEVVAEDDGTTCTCTVAVSPEAVAVTVMVRVTESPAVDSVAVAAPVASVVPCVTAMPPELAEKVTSTPEIRSLAEFRARTVMVAVVEPSDGIDVALVIAVSDEATTPPPLLLELLLLLELELEPELLLVLLPPGPVIVLPPQAERSQAAATAMIDNLRMSCILVRRLPFRDGN